MFSIPIYRVDSYIIFSSLSLSLYIVVEVNNKKLLFEERERETRTALVIEKKRVREKKIFSLNKISWLKITHSKRNSTTVILLSTLIIIKLNKKNNKREVNYIFILSFIVLESFLFVGYSEIHSYLKLVS